MSSYNNNFTVPTLSLTSSRAKKQYGSVIPTRDYSQNLLSNAPTNQNDVNLQNKPQPSISNNPYTQPQKYRRPPIFPPKPPNPQKNQTIPQNTADYSAKDLNKNVYLETREEYSTAQYERNAFPKQEGSNGGELRTSGSKRGLLSNPISSRLVEEEVNQRSLSRKADISKVLFDRKLSKLLEEANFFDGEMMAICKDELTPHLQELQRIREENVNTHRDILQGLNALIN